MSLWFALVLSASFPPYSPAVLHAASPPEKETFGAEANSTGDPVGGGKGYSRHVGDAKYDVKTKKDLLRALKRARAGQVVYVDDDAVINLTGEKKLVIRRGVTLAGGRGRAKSGGALLFTTDLAARPMFATGGEKVRITGLRVRGPDQERRKKAYEAPNSDGIHVVHPGFEIDNCELFGWSHAAIFLSNAGAGHHIHHNFIHHNQRSGLGYGVCLDRSEALIEANIFDWNRHHIAGTGRPGTSYEARYNLSLQNASSYNFDMHGGRDRKDGTDIGGTWIHIHHNTFKGKPPHGAVLICGVPERWAKVHHNWFAHDDPAEAAGQYYKLDAGMYVYRNLCGPEGRLLGTAVRATRKTPVYHGDKPVAEALKGEEFALFGFEEGRYEIEFPAAGKKRRKRRLWIKAADARVILLARAQIAGMLNQGLAAHYVFDESSGKTVRDRSGNGNHAKIHSRPRFVKDGTWYALRFDGRNDHLDCGAASSLNIANAGAVMLWFKPEQLGSGVLAVSTGLRWDDQRLAIFTRTSGLVQSVMANGKEHQFGSFGKMKPNSWIHVAMTWDDEQSRFYRDGTLTQTSRMAWTPEMKAVSLRLGRSQGLGKSYFKGFIGEVRIYSRTLMQQEVEYHYQTTARQ